MNPNDGEIPHDLQELVETLAENNYSLRVRQRHHAAEASPDLLPLPPYEELSETENQDHRNGATETLKLILNRFRLVPAELEDTGAIAVLRAAQDLDEIARLGLTSLLALWQAHSPEEWANTPGIYRRAGRRVLKLAEPLMAYDILS